MQDKAACVYEVFFQADLTAVPSRGEAGASVANSSSFKVWRCASFAPTPCQVLSSNCSSRLASYGFFFIHNTHTDQSCRCVCCLDSRLFYISYSDSYDNKHNFVLKFDQLPFDYWANPQEFLWHQSDLKLRQFAIAKEQQSNWRLSQTLKVFRFYYFSLYTRALLTSIVAWLWLVVISS